MAVFRQELNWSAYQDTQLKVLESIDKSLEKSFQIGKSLASNMGNIENAILSMSKASETSAMNIAAVTKHLVGSATEYTREVQRARDTTRELSTQMDRTTRSTERMRQTVEDTGSTFKSVLGQIESDMTVVFKNLWDHIGGFQSIGQSANELSRLSNQMIMISGMSGEMVKSFRSEIMSVVSDLNRTTGSLYSPTQSYQMLISTSQGITSNLESIQEMARPLLLTQEGLDVSINEVADLFNRFYTRYNFSSHHMEEALDGIRGNTAGNSANAEATLDNIKSLENWIGFIAGNDNEKRTMMMEEISNYTSWLESMDIDSKPYTDYLNSIAYGDYSAHPELANILTRGGMSTTEATRLFQEGGHIEEITESLINGIYSAFDTVDGSLALGAALDNMGLDRNTAMEAWNVMNSDGFVSLQEFLENQSQSVTPTLEQLAEDKYVSAADKANHWLEQIYSKVASLQETLGIGLTDILLGMTLLKGTSLGSRGSLGSILGSTRTSTGLLGALEMGGFNSSAGALVGGKAVALGAAGIAGVGTGLGMGYYGISEGINDIRSGDTGYGVANIAGGTAGLVGAGALGAGLLGVGATNIWNPIGWAALIAGGVTLLATNLHKSAKTIGSAEAVEKAYNEAARNIRNQAKKQENSLLEIKSGLIKYNEIIESGTKDEQKLLEAEKLLSEQKQALIEAGILSEEEARTTNAESLMKLTEAYLKATDQWSTESEAMLDKYKKSDLEYASNLHGKFEELLQRWNDEDRWGGEGQLEAAESAFFSLYTSLQDRASSGETFDKKTQKIYEDMEKAFADSKLSAKEANMIIDEGALNDYFQHANFSPEELMRAVSIMSVTNNAGSGAYTEITEGLGSYYGPGSEYVVDIVGKLKAGKDNNTMTSEKAKELLDELQSNGFTSATYKEIGEVASKWGLKGYAEGTNYINRDQIALLHEGEAVVPKKYNPAINNAEFNKLADQVTESQRDSKRESQVSNAYMNELVESMKEIKEFLEVWKSDNIKRETANDIKNRYATNRSFIQRYLADI